MNLPLAVYRHVPNACGSLGENRACSLLGVRLRAGDHSAWSPCAPDRPVSKMLTSSFLLLLMLSTLMPAAAYFSTCHSVAGYTRERSRRLRFARRRCHGWPSCGRFSRALVICVLK